MLDLGVVLLKGLCKCRILGITHWVTLALRLDASHGSEEDQMIDFSSRSHAETTARWNGKSSRRCTSMVPI